MHEMSIGQSLVNEVCRAYRDLDPVPAGLQTTHVRIGALHQIVPEYLEEAYQRFAEGTVAQGSRLEVHAVEVQATCGRCGWSGAIQLPFIRCGGCGAAGVEVNTGRELQLERLEVIRHDD